MERLGAARGSESTMRSSPAAASRRATASVVVAAALLLLLQGPPPAEPAGEPARAAAPAPLPDEAAIARVLARWNPQLSEAERMRIARAVTRSSDKYGLDPELVTAVIVVESEVRPTARSPRGAVGLMQVMPSMIAPLRLAGNSMTVESNVEAGCRILADNVRRFGEEDGILVYFWGPNIRGDAYLERVRAARAAVRRLLISS